MKLSDEREKSVFDLIALGASTLTIFPPPQQPLPKKQPTLCHER